jgi:23S rRNA U2552 (ribose-2'-O)-methylase RlmE/FtsJ
MVKKYIFKLSNNEPPKEDPEYPSINQSRILNDHLHNFLRKRKDCISEHYKSKKWDRFKKLSNEYELIYTTSSSFPSVSTYPAISRSFFKLWEILSDFEDTMHFKTRKNIKALFLAEGPGGFLEAFSCYRPPDLFKKDHVYGVTLISPDKNIPYWKIPAEILNCGNVKLLKGVDGTGSLYNTQNIIQFKKDIGGSCADLITSDGGFDFSMDFNNQEEISMYLIASEIFATIALQGPRGTCIIKIYDVHSLRTIKLMWILSKHYEQFHIIKPLSSRPANSEKYIVCHGFRGIIHSLYNLLENLVTTQDYTQLDTISMDATFFHQIVNYNVFYISRQVIYINKTLAFIKTIKHDKNDSEFVDNIRKQLCKSIKWCHKYSIKISLDTLQYYGRAYLGKRAIL